MRVMRVRQVMHSDAGDASEIGCRVCVHVTGLTCITSLTRVTCLTCFTRVTCVTRLTRVYDSALITSHRVMM